MPLASPRAARALLLLGALQALAVAGYFAVEATRGAPRVGRPLGAEPSDGPSALPEVELVRADGTPAPTSALRGRPVLLHFWATWCRPCREELPALLDLAAREPELTLLAVSLDGRWEDVTRFFGGRVPPAVVRDPSGVLAGSYRVSALPDTYLLDGGGRARLRFAGAQPWHTEAAREALKRAR